MKKKKKIRTKSVKQKLRDVDRTMEHAKVTGKSEAAIVEASKEKIHSLKIQARDQRKEKFTDKKYDQIKLREKKKLVKKLEKAKEANAPEEVMRTIQGKLSYIKYFPKGVNYMSILRDDDELCYSSRLKRTEILKETSDKRTMLLKQKLALPFEQEKLNKHKQVAAKPAQVKEAPKPKVAEEEKVQEVGSENENESEATEIAVEPEVSLDGVEDDDFFM